MNVDEDSQLCSATLWCVLLIALCIFRFHLLEATMFSRNPVMAATHILAIPSCSFSSDILL